MKIITRDLSTAKGGIERNTVEGVCTRSSGAGASYEKKKEGGGRWRGGAVKERRGGTQRIF